MKKFLAAAVMSMALASLAQAAPMPKGDAAAGEAKAAACFACHGVGGVSMVPVNPSLAGQGARYIYKQLQDFKSGRRGNPVMMGMALPLADQDMADLAAYFSSQKAVVNKAKPELVKLGEKVFRGGNKQTGLAACAGCHNPAGKGNALAGYPRLGGQHADYVKAQLIAFRAAGRNDNVADPSAKRVNDAAKAGEMGPMQMIAARMSDAEIDAVASYISGLY
jgi:cytochrome c553